MPEPVAISNRPLWARLFAALWAAEAVMGGVFAATGVARLAPAENGMAVLMILFGALLAVAGTVMADVSWRAARLDGPALEFTAATFRDRRLSEQAIPWEAVEWRVVFNGLSHGVQFDLAPHHRASYRTRWSHRILGVFNRAFRYPEFSVTTVGTGLGVQQLAALMECFKKRQS